MGWDLSQENFFVENASFKWLNQVKIRSTYGRTGNDNVGYFTWRTDYLGGNVSNGTFDVYNFGPDRASTNGIAQNRLANPLVSWEKADKVNVGIDLAIFNNHLQATAEYYNNKYFDLMQLRGKRSSILGIEYPIENIGVNRYTGNEFSLTYQNNYKNLHYFITGNLSIERTEVLYMDEIEQPYPWMVRTGLPVGMPFGYVADGFIQSEEEARTSAASTGYTLQPGDIKLKDLNNDGTINEYDIAPIGTTKPLTYYGVTFGFNFKGFDMSILFQGVENRVYSLTDPSFGQNGQSQAFGYIVGRWTPETADQATYPRLTPGFNANNDINPFFGGNVNSFWMHSGDYLRLKNVDIGYTLPYKITNRLKVSSMRVFANALNLVTWADYNRVDPEVYNQVYPNQRVVNFGVNLKF